MPRSTSPTRAGWAPWPCGARSRRSAPALLKTLEEPPPSTVFVLLAEDMPPELVTVASRCLEVPFPPVPPGAIAEWLVARQVDRATARLIAEGAGGDVDRARLLVEDAELSARQALWRSVPQKVGGDGAVAGALARDVLAATERALGPLRAVHGRELDLLEEDARAAGERGVPGRKELIDRHRREERRWRTDELRLGLGVLARAYRDRMVGALEVRDEDGAASARGAGAAAAAVGLVTEAAGALGRNANETLLLEALFVRLGRGGG